LISILHKGELQMKLRDTTESKVMSVLEERGNRYGDFKDNSWISQELKDILRSSNGYEENLCFVKEGLEMIVHKLSRIVNGDALYEDNWVDIIGYTQLVLDNIKRFKDTVEIKFVGVVGSENCEKDSRTFLGTLPKGYKIALDTWPMLNTYYGGDDEEESHW